MVWKRRQDYTGRNLLVDYCNTSIKKNDKLFVGESADSDDLSFSYVYLDVVPETAAAILQSAEDEATQRMSKQKERKKGPKSCKMSLSPRIN